MALMKSFSNKTGTDSGLHSSEECLFRLASRLWPALTTDNKLTIIEALEMAKAKQPVKKLTPAEQIKALAEVNQADELLARHGVGLTPAHFRKAVKAILK